MSKKFKIKVLKGWICRTPERSKQFKKHYKEPSLKEKLQNNNYSFINK